MKPFDAQERQDCDIAFFAHGHYNMLDLTNHCPESLLSIHLPYLTLSHCRDDDGGDAEHL